MDLAACNDIFGDDVERAATWKTGALAEHRGRPIRPRFLPKDAANLFFGLR
jgi:hypothetical protein